MLMRHEAEDPAPPDRQQFGDLIQAVLAKLENQGTATFRFAQIAECDKRRQSDLFHILDALDAFAHIEGRHLAWRGFGATPAAFTRVGIQNEIYAQFQPITEIFHVGPSPKLPNLVTKFISLYIFLGVSSLNIREVVNLMAETEGQAKKILRRLYLVVFVLEKLQIVQHGFGHSQYILKLPLDAITNAIFDEIGRSPPFRVGSVQASMNRFDQDYIKHTRAQRMRGYVAAVRRFGLRESPDGSEGAG